MAKKPREFFDTEHQVMDAYYDLCENYAGRSAKTVKRQLKRLIEKDPDFFDPYLLLYELLQDEGNQPEAEKILNAAYERALKLITDTKGNWPDVLEWAWLENRHIIKNHFEQSYGIMAKRRNGQRLRLI